MTTIAYKDGVVAVDSLAVQGGSVAGHVYKIIRMGDVRYIGVGDWAEINWAARSMHLHNLESFRDLESARLSDETIILTCGGGLVYVHSRNGDYEHPVAQPGAWGTGADIALGAMAAGATAEKAVECAVLYDLNTDGPVHTCTIDER